MLALSDAGCIVWKNPTGTAYQGRVIHKDGRSITLADHRMVTFGLAVGSADLIGISPAGKFMAIEVKAGRDRERTEQQAFIEAVRRRGGLACFARSVEDAVNMIHHN